VSDRGTQFTSHFW
jgi:hypothetical protein